MLHPSRKNLLAIGPIDNEHEHSDHVHHGSGRLSSKVCTSGFLKRADSWVRRRLAAAGSDGEPCRQLASPRPQITQAQAHPCVCDILLLCVFALPICCLVIDTYRMRRSRACWKHRAQDGQGAVHREPEPGVGDLARVVAFARKK